MSYRVSVSRRALLTAAAGGAAAGLFADPLRAAVFPRSDGRYAATPWQTPGPFYPRDVPLDSDTDLVRVAGQPRPAAGTPVQIFGRVLTDRGKPVPGARVELWQCDAFGRYHHPRDRGGNADPAFQGYGHTTVGDEAAFRFRTIKPVAYPGRAPHIHFAVSGPGFERLTTQMYVAGEPLNQRDGILNRIADPLQRKAVIVALGPAPEVEELAGTFDIVLGRDRLQG